MNYNYTDIDTSANDTKLMTMDTLYEYRLIINGPGWLVILDVNPELTNDQKRKGIKQ